jgi:hypothetical protein
MQRLDAAHLVVGGGGLSTPNVGIDRYCRLNEEKKAKKMLSPFLTNKTAITRSKRVRLEPSEIGDETVVVKLDCARRVKAAPHGDKKRVVRMLAAKYGRSPGTIRRWAKAGKTLRVRRPPAVVLAEEKVRLPAARKFHPTALAWGLAFYAENLRAGKKAAYVAMCVESTKHSDWRVGDYTNFVRLTKKIPDAIWDRIKKGAIGFELHHIPKIAWDWLQVPVQTVLCGDQHIFDYVVYDPAIDEVFTPECYLWMDCTSRHWPGLWPEMGHYNKFTVGYALREACRYGLPDEVYTDWGKPEISGYTAQVVSRLSGMVKTGSWADFQMRYGVKATQAQAGKPWQKPIENQMNIFEKMLADCHLAGYRKRDTDAWINKTRQQAVRRAVQTGKLVDIETFLQTIFQIQEDHAYTMTRVQERPSPIVPAKVYFSGLKRQNRTVLDDVTLDYLFLPMFERKPDQCVVKMALRRGERRAYYSPALSGVKDKVFVSVDPYDAAAPAVITDAAGKYVDLAEPWRPQSFYDKAGMAQKRARQAELLKWWQKQVANLRGGFGLIKNRKKKAAVIELRPDAAAAHAAKKGKTQKDALHGSAKKAGASLLNLYNRTKGA